MSFRMPDSYYNPPEPEPCCEKWEDDEDHDVDACLTDQAEAAAEARAERQREDAMEARYEDRYYG